MLLYEKLKDKNLILASRSPRRRELMEGAGLTFTVRDGSDAEETYPEDMVPAEVPQYLAIQKSNAFPDPLGPDDILITADTVVILDGEIIGKPRDRDDAIAMLTKLSGKKHTVITGVAIRSRSKGMAYSVKSDVWFRKLKDEEIEYYVDTYLPMDKAGSYGIQEWIGYVGIGRIEGSFYNVMGLPIQTLYVNLEKFIEE